jgi:HEAT repeat protein
VPGHGFAKPWALRSRYLCFLDAEPAVEGRPQRFRLISGAFSLRPIGSTGPETRFPGIVRDISATLGAAGRVKDAPALRTLLVGWMDDADPGVAWSAATDFVRLEVLHAGLTDTERERIVAAYRRCPIGKTTKQALAFAVAATRHPSAAPALVETLLDPNARLVRGDVAEALRRLRDPATETLIDRRLVTADAPARKSLLVALGAIGTEASVPAARRSLVDDDAVVRTEAAHALGLIARNVRETDAAARVDVRVDLAHALTAAKTDDERRATLWALAQLDDQEAWKILRLAAADETASEVVRTTAARYLKSPRVSLLLE